MAAVQSLHSNQGKVSRKDAKSAWLQADFLALAVKLHPKVPPGVQEVLWGFVWFLLLRSLSFQKLNKLGRFLSATEI